jgi:hypothetical protein
VLEEYGILDESMRCEKGGEVQRSVGANPKGQVHKSQTLSGSHTEQNVSRELTCYSSTLLGNNGNTIYQSLSWPPSVSGRTRTDLPIAVFDTHL